MYVCMYVCMYMYTCVCILYIYIYATPASCTYLFVLFKCIFPCQPLAKALKHVNTGHEVMWKSGAS